MDLQQAFSRFKADLEAYITEEVARQVAAQMGGSAPVRTEVSQDPVIGSAGDVQASLDALAALAKQSTQAKDSSAVDQLLTDFGGTSATVAPAPVANNGDYLAELAAMSKSSARKNDNSSIDALMAMSGSTSAAATPVAPAPMAQPPQAAPVATQEASTVSGIQSFLDKIRQRKNLSSN